MQLDQHTLDKKGVHKLLQHLAEKHPDQYSKVIKTLNDVGREAAWTEGVSVSLSGLRTSKAKQAIMAELTPKIDAIRDDDSLSDEERSKAIIATLIPYTSKMQDAVMEEARQEGNNPYHLQIESGARGKKTELSSLRGADLLVQDQHGKFIPVPITRSYAEGFKPADYFAAGYGQRAGQIAVKMCLSGDTLVRMADWTVQRIDEINPGDWVIGTDEHGRMLPVEVKERFNNGLRQCVKSTFSRLFTHDKSSSAIELVSTVDHKILSEWRPSMIEYRDSTPKLRKVGSANFFKKPSNNPLVATPPRVDDQSPDWGIDEPRALFLGLMLGDGCSRGNRHQLSCGDPTMLTELADYFKSIYINPVKGCAYTHVLTSTQVFDRNRDKLGRVISSGHPTLTWLRDCGCWNTYAHEKRVPEVAWTWNRKSVAMLVAGLIATDGCFSKTNLGGCAFSFVSTSHALITGLCDLLAIRLGIYCNPLTFVPIRVGSNMRHPQWELRVSQLHEMRQLRKLISIPGKKGKRWDEILASAPDSAKRFGFRCDRQSSVGELATFDLEVDHPAHLFVLANGLIVSNSVADSGYGTKTLVNSAHRVVVTKETPDATRLPVGLPVDVKDPELVGQVLAHDAGDHKAGTLITEQIKNDLVDGDIDEVLVHSAMTEPTSDGGISRLAAGKRHRVGLTHIGDNVGIAAAQAIGEKWSQGLLAAKHSAGISDRVSKSGVEYIFKLLGAPEHFAEAGPLSEHDGDVEDVRKADQGGHYVKVSGKEYYINPGLTPTVKKGDRVESGDDLSDGVPHPQQLVKLRGLGEARKVYADALHSAFNESGVTTSKRNTQAVVAGLMNWAKVTNPDGIGDNVVDDIAPFNRLAYNYKPRATAQLLAPKQAVGKYLEEPVLHYTPGTKVNSRVLSKLQQYGIKDVHVHDDHPDFEPEFVRSVLGVYHDPDWQTRLAGFYTASAFQKSVHRGGESDANSTSYFPALAKGVGFGQKLTTTGTYGS